MSFISHKANDTILSFSMVFQQILTLTSRLRERKATSVQVFLHNGGSGFAYGLQTWPVGRFLQTENRNLPLSCSQQGGCEVDNTNCNQLARHHPKSNYPQSKTCIIKNKQRKFGYRWPLSNTGLNCADPRACNIFSITT